MRELTADTIIRVRRPRPEPRKRELTGDTRIRLDQIKELKPFYIIYFTKPLIEDIRPDNSYSPDGTKQKHGDHWDYVPADQRANAETDVEGRPFETTSTGSMFFGEITQEMAEKMGTNVAAPIKLSEGNLDYGKKHIEKFHWHELMPYYEDVNEFVEDVAQHFTAIYQGEQEKDKNGKVIRNTFILAKRYQNGTIYIELYEKDGSPYYSVNSGGYWPAPRPPKVKKNKNGNKEEKQKNEMVWCRPAPRPYKKAAIKTRSL